MHHEQVEVAFMMEERLNKEQRDVINEQELDLIPSFISIVVADEFEFGLEIR